MRIGKDDEDAIQRKKTLLRMILVPGLGIRSCHQILAHVHDPRAVVSLKPADLKLFGIKREIARDFLSAAAEDRAETEWNRTATLGVRIIDMKDPRFPQLLLETSDPPLVLYVKGMAWQPERPHIAVVGARQASAYGTNCAEHFARELADRGIVVVSGLARGIDTAAHTGALSKGSTVAIFGTGIDRVYPAENRRLAESIVQKGAILSEFPLGTPPLPAHFPRRNRILAGMTLGTIVVEAAERSGSLITARLALESNREVFAVPGPIQSAKSRGPHILIRQGACLATTAEDIIEELSGEVRRQIDAIETQGPQEIGVEIEPHAALSGAAERVRDLLSSSEETPLDILIVKLQLPVPKVYSALLELELGGLIRQMPGDRYILKM